MLRLLLIFGLTCAEAFQSRSFRDLLAHRGQDLLLQVSGILSNNPSKMPLFADCVVHVSQGH